jgi:hypothetical protein
MAVRPEERTLGAPSFIRWGPVFAGAIVGLAILFLFNAFWMALGEGSDIDGVARNMHWFGLASSLIALFVGGLLAGWMTGHGGLGLGLLNGLTVWGLILVATLVLDVPASLEVFGFTAAPLSEWGADPLWATFWSLLGGLIVAGIGGVVGGGLPRPAWAGAPYGAVDTEHRVVEERPVDRPADRPVDDAYTEPGVTDERRVR